MLWSKTVRKRLTTGCDGRNNNVTTVKYDCVASLQDDKSEVNVTDNRLLGEIYVPVEMNVPLLKRINIGKRASIARRSKRERSHR
jgi:hypothetical protein